MRTMPSIEIDKAIAEYQTRFQRYGYSPKTLGWLKGKQDIRFDILSSFYNFTNKSILDIGCGFGDLYSFLSKKFGTFQYTGCDICDFLIKEGKTKFPEASFFHGDFLSLEFTQPIDWALASGPFTYKFEEMDNYEFIYNTMSKAFSLVRDGLSFDFSSDKVDYQLDETFHASPEKILSMAYSFSRNVILRSDYMPFEFSVFIFKDDKFDKDDTLFHKYKRENIA